MNWHSSQQIIEKLLPPSTTLRCIRANNAVRQFQHGHHRNSDLWIVGLEADHFQHPVSSLAQPLRGDDHGRIEDQSHAGGSRDSRWFSMAACTSRAKPASMVAVESFGMSANTSEILRRGGAAGRRTATGR